MHSPRKKGCKPVPEEAARAIDLLGRRWLLAIVYASHGGAIRFNEFKRVLVGIPPRTLAQRLADLEEEGILERLVTDARPPRVEYRLTDRGLRLRSLVQALDRCAGSLGSAERKRA
jgi:DNA-binding HxlR family transcriptional regulator